MKTVAKDQNVTLPATLDPKDQALENRLDALSGRAFDRAYAYMSAMVRDHRKDVAEFHAEGRRAETTEVKDYASKALPTRGSSEARARD